MGHGTMNVQLWFSHWCLSASQPLFLEAQTQHVYVEHVLDINSCNLWLPACTRGIQWFLKFFNFVLDIVHVWIQYIFVEIKNWKYCNKIIFKCVNNVVGSVNNVWTMRKRCHFFFIKHNLKYQLAFSATKFQSIYKIV